MSWLGLFVIGMVVLIWFALLCAALEMVRRPREDGDSS